MLQILQKQRSKKSYGNPFNKAESHYVDAKFYFEVTIDDEVPVEDDSKKGKGLFNEVHSSSTEDPKEKSKAQKQQINSKPWHIPVTKKIERQGSFKSQDENIVKELKDLILPITNLMVTKETQEPLKGFVKPSQGSAIEHGDLPSKRVNGFDPNTYKLLAKAGFGQRGGASSTKG